MNAESLYLMGCLVVIGAAALTFPILLFISAPYGRHGRAGWGMTLPARVVWVVQESPSVLLFAAIFFLGAQRFQTVPLILFFLWQAHYFQRTFIFPFQMRMAGKRDPVSIMALAILFNTFNASVNAWAISSGRMAYEVSWLWDPRFIVGLSLFILGYVINRHSDSILRNLRQPGEKGYKIPQGGLYRWITCPNYFGELLEWTGWAIASWSLGGLAFALFTAANLIPRARTHHQWYLTKFADYPRERKFVIPFVY